MYIPRRPGSHRPIAASGGSRIPKRRGHIRISGGRTDQLCLSDSQRCYGCFQFVMSPDWEEGGRPVRLFPHPNPPLSWGCYRCHGTWSTKLGWLDHIIIYIRVFWTNMMLTRLIKYLNIGLLVSQIKVAHTVFHHYFSFVIALKGNCN